MKKYEPNEFRNFIFKLRYEEIGLWANSWGMYEIIFFGKNKYFDGEFIGRSVDIKNIQINSGLIQYVGIPKTKENIQRDKYVIKREEMDVKDIVYISNKIKKISFDFSQLMFSPAPVIDAGISKFEIEFMFSKITLENHEYNLTNLKSIEMIEKRIFKLLPLVSNELDELDDFLF